MSVDPKERPSERRPSKATRVRVTSPRMGTASTAAARSTRREIDEDTVVGEVYLRSLLRTQLRVGLGVIGLLALGLGLLPIAFRIVPGLGSVRVLSVPLPWLVVGVGVYPLLILAAWWLVRTSERAEQDFIELVERR